MSLDAAPPPEMESINSVADQTVPPTANENSDELFGEDQPQADSAKRDTQEPTPPATMNEPLDQQPASTEPIAGTSSGIDGVAQFIPSDAKLNHSTPPPSQPLATDAADINPDAAMTDAPASAPNDIPVPADSSSSVSVANATASDKAAATDTLAPPPGEDVKDLPDQTAQPTSVTSAPDAEATAASAPVPDADQTMQDALASGTVRQREDDETTGEPAAKRAKTGEATNDQVLEFKQPDAPTTAPVASPATNGDSTANRPSRSFSKSPITTTQKNALMEKLKNTKKVKSAFWFLRPVDYVALNIPHYPDIIKHPMDLSTIEKKLKNDDYTCMDDLVADFELMVENCQKFNGPAHNVTASALSMRAYFMKQMESIPTGNAAAHPPKGVATKKQPPPAPKQSAARRQSKPGAGVTHSAATGDTYALQPNGTPLIRRDSTADRPKRAVVPPASRDLPYAAAKPKRKDAAAGLKFCEHMMEELKKKPKYKKLTEPFLVPVDPVALQIPHYFSIIKHPMDLQTMGQKLKGGQYASDREFKADFDLMIENCKKFNGPQNPIYAFAVDLQSEFDKDWVKKDAWVKKFERPPVSRPISEASSDESDAEEDEEEHDANDAQIQMLQQQISALQNTLQTMSQSKRSSPKAGGKKKSKGNGKTKKASTLPTPAPRAAPKPKAKKQRQVTYEEKQEISSATEKMSESQVQKLTQIIAENVPKYNDMGEDMELEIDELPNDVQHKLLQYVRKIFPKERATPDEEEMNVDDDYEPERNARATGNVRKKHKPMKKHEQEASIKALREQLAQMSGGPAAAQATATAAPAAAAESSDDDDSESSEEE